MNKIKLTIAASLIGIAAFSNKIKFGILDSLEIHPKEFLLIQALPLQGIMRQ
jgi:hypothetical protein